MAIERMKNSQKDEPQSPELSETLHLAKLMDSVLSRYPNQQITADSSRAWLADWKILVQRMGREKFEWALRECCLSSKFFPSSAEIVEMSQGFYKVPVYKALTMPEDKITPQDWKEFKEKVGILSKTKQMPKGKRA